MLAVILVIIGAALMLFGLFMLWGWLNGRSRWFDSGVFDREGASKIDRQFLDLYYIALVLAPLMCGAIIMAFGLRKWL